VLHISCAQSGELKNANLNTKDFFSAQAVPSQLSFSPSCPSNAAAAPGSKAAMSAEASSPEYCPERFISSL